MSRRPTYPTKGAHTLERARELVRAFTALARGPWTLKKSAFVAGSLSPGRPNARTDAQSVGRDKDLTPISVPEEPDAERIAVPCFVIFAPGGRLPRVPVSNEGGFIRSGFDSRDGRAPTVK